MSHFLNDLEMRLWKNTKLVCENKDFLLMVSGGLDSMVLLSMFQNMKTRLSANFRVLYVHHGLQTESDYRNLAYEFLQSECQKMQIEFCSNYSDRLPEKDLNSEEELRDFRYEIAREFKKPNELLVLAQHKEDQLETRLIRLIRGTGSNGLQAMKNRELDLYRPFLEFSRKDLENYAQEKSVRFLEDPSNQDEKYLRNWIRLKWLPELEHYRQGSIASLARSLENLSQDLYESEDWLDEFLEGDSFSRLQISCLDRKKQLRLLSKILSQNGVINFKKTQLEEILKRLDTNQNDLKFNLLGLEWNLKGDKLEISPQNSPKVPMNQSSG